MSLEAQSSGNERNIVTCCQHTSYTIKHHVFFGFKRSTLSHFFSFRLDMRIGNFDTSVFRNMTSSQNSTAFFRSA